QSPAPTLQGALAHCRRKPSWLKTVAVVLPNSGSRGGCACGLRRKGRFYKVNSRAVFNGAVNARAIVVFNDSTGRLSMRRQILPSLLVGGAMRVSSGLCHQQPPAPNLDAVPKKMPFSTAYGSPIGAKRANAVIEAAAAEASKKGWPMNIAVVDSGANLVA